MFANYYSMQGIFTDRNQRNGRTTVSVPGVWGYLQDTTHSTFLRMLSTIKDYFVKHNIPINECKVRIIISFILNIYSFFYKHVILQYFFRNTTRRTRRFIVTFPVQVTFFTISTMLKKISFVPATLRS